jgi:hypothetical protein
MVEMREWQEFTFTLGRIIKENMAWKEFHIKSKVKREKRVNTYMAHIASF